MTVVAVFEDLRVAVSDVLLTTDQPGRHLTIPTTGYTGNLLSALPLSPTRLVRKYVEFKAQSGRGMLLAAGNVEHIEKLAENLQCISNGTCALPTHLQHLLADRSPWAIADTASRYTEFQGFSQFEVIGSAGDALYTRTFDASAIKLSLPYFGVVRAIGSGAADVANWLEARANHWIECGLDSDDLEIKRFRTMHMLPAIFLEQDTRSTLHTLTKGVGGYYEAYWLGKDELIPMDSVLTIFATIVGKPRNYTVELRRLFFHLYKDGWLFVVSLFNLPKIVGLGHPLKCPLGDLEQFPIPPLTNPTVTPNWTVDRLAMQACAAGHTRLILSKDVDSKPITRRFFQGHQPLHRLFDLKVSGGYLNIALNQAGFSHFGAKFLSSVDDPMVLKLW